MSTLYVDNLQPNLGSQVEIPDLKPLAGSVVQVKEAAAPSSGTVTFTSNSFTDIGLSVSITPTASSSKFLILYTCPVFVIGTGGSAAGGGFRLYRDTTSIDDPQGDINGVLGNWLNLQSFGSGSNYWDYFWTHTGNVMDSPSTTSTINYNVKYAHRQGNSSKIGYDGSNHHPRCRMTVMEIAQ